jgi:NDP-sugar pyrophosphorylase family protein
VNEVRALVMAGGRSERMRATNGPRHKALVEVGGIPLIERNLRSLFARGIDDVVVVTSAGETAIAAFVSGPGAELAQRYGARLSSFVEVTALGNIGVVAEFSDANTDLLVSYVDNLSSLDERALIERHRESAAAMTLATHLWVLRNPFGELELVDGFVRAYREKPARLVRISSGTCVVGPAAARAVPRGRPFGVSELCAKLFELGLPVAAFAHEEPWVDVNDALALAEAEALVRHYPERFA